MKICLLNDSFTPVIDGVVNVMMNYADYLSRDHGAEVMVGTPRYPDADYSAYPYPVVPYPSFDTTAITDGKNGFTIEETPEAMAALLREACRDLNRLHEVGEKAMNEIVLSWRDCVSAAYERYELVLEEKKRGALQKRSSPRIFS